MRKIFFFFLLLIFTGSVFAQIRVPGKKMTERELAISKIDEELDKSTVLESLRKCVLAISRGNKDGNALRTEQYHPYTIRIKMFLDYKWFIADTGLSRKWLKEVYQLLKYMYKTRSIIETAIYNKENNTPKAKQALKYYNVAYERFVKLVKKPVKVSAKSVRKAKVRKVMWQKAMRKKYKIKGKVNADF